MRLGDLEQMTKRELYGLLLLELTTLMSYRYILDLRDGVSHMDMFYPRPTATLREFRAYMRRPEGVSVDAHGGRHYLRVSVKYPGESSCKEMTELDETIDFTKSVYIQATWVRI